MGVHANPAVTGAAAWARAVAPRAGRSVEDTVVAATGTEGTPKVGVDADALTIGRTRGPGTTTPTPDAGRVCTVAAARCAAVREALAEDPAADDEGEDAEPSAGVLSAEATPAPANAAPTPRVNAPAPNHAYG